MHPQTEPELTPACPFCRGTGVPREVTMHAGERTIQYACSTCQKTWTIKNLEFQLTGSGKESSR
jgi:hypothetical protein